MLYLPRECHQLVKEAGCLVTQEGSLALSLAQLPREDTSLAQLPREGSLAELPAGGPGEASGEAGRS